MSQEEKLPDFGLDDSYIIQQEEEIPDFGLDDSFVLQEEHNLDNLDNLELNPQEETINTSGHTTREDITGEDSDIDLSFGTQENPGQMTLEELEGGAGKKKKKTTKKKITKKKTIKKKTTKKKTTKKKTTKKKKTRKNKRKIYLK
jgi:hypothetical protein